MTTETGEVLQTEPIPTATAEQVAPPTDVTAAPEDVQKQADKTFTQAELDAIVQTRLAKAERQHLKELRGLQTQQPATKAPEDKPPPRDQYATDEEWVDAKVDWKLAQRDRAQQAEKALEAQQTTAQKAHKVVSDAAKLPGFDREAFDSLTISDAVTQAILDSDIAPRLLAHMTANPEVAERISKLSPARQAAEIGRLEEKLSVVKPVNTAPPPVKTASGAGPVHNGDLSKLPMDQYIAARAKMGARWAPR